MWTQHTVQEEIHIWTYFLSLPNRDGPFADCSQASGDKPTLSRYQTSVYARPFYNMCLWAQADSVSRERKMNHHCSDCRCLTCNKFPESALLVGNKSHLEPLKSNHSNSFPRLESIHCITWQALPSHLL